jgi:hypothetical protein
MGGKIFTTPQWVHDFGRRLAEADAAYFERNERVADAVPMGGDQSPDAARRAHIQQINDELADAGL